MKKVIIAGSFDCISQKDVNLIKESLKLAVGGELWAILPDDHQHFKMYGSFPYHKIQHRADNLSYFIPKCRVIYRSEYLKHLPISFIKEEDDHILFVHYGDDKDFPGREQLAADNIKIKFIKPYVEA